jgi:hypothetical protein
MPPDGAGRVEVTDLMEANPKEKHLKPDCDLWPPPGL